MGKCMFLRKGETHTAPVSYKANFADNTWEQIIDACQKNKVPATWLVGDQKTMDINGTSYAFDIIGKNHDTYSDGSGTAPLTFQMHNVYGTSYPMNNSSASYWSSCVMRSTTLPSILSLMPSEVQAGIKAVKKLTNQAAFSTDMEETSDTLFLLAEIEVFGTVTNSRDGEGIQYEYYKAGNSKIKGNMKWWCRSPDRNGTSVFCGVNTNGTARMESQTNYNFIAPAFCF